MKSGTHQQENASPSTQTTSGQKAVNLEAASAEEGMYMGEIIAGIQAKLIVGAPDDPLEREADAMADQVVNQWGDGGEASFSSNISSVDEEKLQQKSTGNTPASDTQLSSKQLISQKGKGQSLPNGIRAKMDSAFGTSFDQVKIHTDRSASQMNDALGARAFTHQNDIFFGQGEYQPQTSEGRKLIAHELTHVVQQKGRNDQNVIRRNSKKEKLEKKILDLSEKVRNKSASDEDKRSLASSIHQLAKIQFDEKSVEMKALKVTEAEISTLKEEAQKGIDQIRSSSLGNSDKSARINHLSAFKNMKDFELLVRYIKLTGSYENLKNSLTLEFGNPKDTGVLASGLNRETSLMKKGASRFIMESLVNDIYLKHQVKKSETGTTKPKWIKKLEKEVKELIIKTRESEIDAKDIPDNFFIYHSKNADKWAVSANVTVVKSNKSHTLKVYPLVTDGVTADQLLQLVRRLLSRKIDSLSSSSTPPSQVKVQISEEDRKILKETLEKIYTPEEIEEIRKKEPDPDQPPISQHELEALRALQTDPYKDQILETLKRNKGKGSKDSSGSLAAVLDRIKAQVQIQETEKLTGVEFYDKDEDSDDSDGPIINLPVEGQIVSGSGSELVVGEDGQFQLVIRHLSHNIFAVPHVYVKWVAIKRGTGSEKATVIAQENTYYAALNSHGLINDKVFNVKFKEAGDYEIHALVRHNFYAPNRIVHPVTVKTQEAVLSQIEEKSNKDTAFGQIDPETTKKKTFSDAVDENNTIKIAAGILSPMTIPFQFLINDDDTKGLESEGVLDDKLFASGNTGFDTSNRHIIKQISQIDDLINRYKNDYQNKHLVKWAKERKARLEKVKKELEGLQNDTAVHPIISRAFYVSREPGFRDGELKLASWFKYDAATGEYTIHLYDHSEIVRTEHFHFQAEGTNYKEVMELLFFQLSKTYPDGKMRFDFQQFEGTKGKKSFTRFEKNTDTLLNDIRKIVFHQVTSAIVNIGAAILTCFPLTAPIGIGISLIYNGADTLLQFADAQRTGTVKASNYVDLGLVALDLLPAIGKAGKLFKAADTAADLAKPSKTLFLLSAGENIAQFAGNAYIMTEAARDQIQQLHDGKISQLAQLQADIGVLIENGASPAIIQQKRREEQTLIRQTRSVAADVIGEMVKNQGLTMASQKAAVSFTQRYVSSKKAAQSGGDSDPTSPADVDPSTNNRPETDPASKTRPEGETPTPKPKPEQVDSPTPKPKQDLDAEAPSLIERDSKAGLVKESIIDTDPELSMKLPARLRDKVPISKSGKKSREVVVYYETGLFGQTKRVRIEAGSMATKADIDVHVKTAEILLQYQGITGTVKILKERVSALVGNRDPRIPRRRVFELELEVKKLNELIDIETNSLNGINRKLSKAETRAHEARIKDLTDQKNGYLKDLQDIDPSTRGYGFIAAEHNLATSNWKTLFDKSSSIPTKVNDRLKALGIDQAKIDQVLGSAENPKSLADKIFMALGEGNLKSQLDPDKTSAIIKKLFDSGDGNTRAGMEFIVHYLGSSKQTNERATKLLDRFPLEEFSHLFTDLSAFEETNKNKLNYLESLAKIAPDASPKGIRGLVDENFSLQDLLLSLDMMGKEKTAYSSAELLDVKSRFSLLDNESKSRIERIVAISNREKGGADSEAAPGLAKKLLKHLLPDTELNKKKSSAEETGEIDPAEAKKVVDDTNAKAAAKILMDVVIESNDRSVLKMLDTVSQRFDMADIGMILSMTGEANAMGSMKNLLYLAENTSMGKKDLLGVVLQSGIRIQEVEVDGKRSKQVQTDSTAPNLERLVGIIESERQNKALESGSPDYKPSKTELLALLEEQKSALTKAIEGTPELTKGEMKGVVDGMKKVLQDDGGATVRGFVLSGADKGGVIRKALFNDPVRLTALLDAVVKKGESMPDQELFNKVTNDLRDAVKAEMFQGLAKEGVNLDKKAREAVEKDFDSAWGNLKGDILEAALHQAQQKFAEGDGRGGSAKKEVLVNVDGSSFRGDRESVKKSKKTSATKESFDTKSSSSVDNITYLPKDKKLIFQESKAGKAVLTDAQNVLKTFLDRMNNEIAAADSPEAAKAIKGRMIDALIAGTSDKDVKGYLLELKKPENIEDASITYQVIRR